MIIPLARNLRNGEHTVDIVSKGDGMVSTDAF